MRRYYISDSQGNIRFTHVGSTLLTPIFAKYGINIRHVRTRRDYVNARLSVRPYFLMEKWLRTTPDESVVPTTESVRQHQLLMDAVFGNHSPEKFQRMISDSRRRSLFSVIDGGL